MRQRNVTGGDLFVQSEPAFVLAPDEVVDHPDHIPGCEVVTDDSPADPPTDPPADEPADPPASADAASEGQEQAPTRARRTKIQEGEVL